MDAAPGGQPVGAARAAAPPPAAGVRLPWSQVPEAIRVLVEAQLGAPVVEAVTQHGGFSPGAAARLRLADGRRAFVKAVGVELNPDSPRMHRAEARIAAALPASAPVPRLLAAFDEDGWVALVFEDVDGAVPAQPWRADELARVLDAARRLAVALNPSPIAAPSVLERFDDTLRGWRLLAAARRAGDDDLSWLDPWARHHVERLAALEADWGAAAAGDALVHGDLRADNVLLTADRVVVVDWPWAAIGAPWFDLVGMVPSLRMQAAPNWRPLVAEHLEALSADAQAVTVVLAALAGFFLRQGHRPPPPGLPTVRAFQRAQGEAALAWLRERRPFAGTAPVFV